MGGAFFRIVCFLFCAGVLCTGVLARGGPSGPPFYVAIFPVSGSVAAGDGKQAALLAGLARGPYKPFFVSACGMASYKNCHMGDALLSVYPSVSNGVLSVRSQTSDGHAIGSASVTLPTGVLHPVDAAEGTITGAELSALLGTIVGNAAGFSVQVPAPSPTPKPPAPVVSPTGPAPIIVFVFPISANVPSPTPGQSASPQVAPAASAAASASPSPSSGQVLAGVINGRSTLYHAVSLDSCHDPSNPCAVPQLRSELDIRRGLSADGGSLLYSSFDGATGIAVGTVTQPLPAQSSPAPGARPDSAYVGMVNNLSGSQLDALLGQPTVVDGNVTLQLQPQVVQVVNNRLNQTDPDYTTLAIEMLARRGIASIAAPATTATTIATGDPATLCTDADRFFVFEVAIDTAPRKLIGFTRLGANADGRLVDCVVRRTTAFAGEDKRSVPTTATTLSEFGVILRETLFPGFAWASIATATTSVSGLVDVDPTQPIARTPVAVVAMQRMVDDFCRAIRPTPAPSPSPAVLPAAGVGRPAPSPTPAPSPSPVFWSYQYRLECNRGRLNVEPTAGPVSRGMLDRWKAGAWDHP